MPRFPLRVERNAKGAAGLAAASRLVEKGFDPARITILEAENRIGGRIFTVQHGSSLIEIGAQWVHGKEGNVVHPLAEAAGEIRTDIHTLESTGYADDVEMVYRDGRKITADQLKEFKEILQRIYADSRRELAQWKTSLGEYFEYKFGKHLDQGSFTTMDRATALDLLDWAHRAQNIEDGSDNWMETCGVGSLEYHECVGDYTTVWKRGYSALFDILMKNVPKRNNGLQLPLSDRIRLNSPVNLVRWNPDRPNCKVEVVCSDQTYNADMVLITCSLGVLKDRADKLFTPLLPEKKRKAIEGIGFGTVDKIFLEFCKPWWNQQWGGVNFLTQHSKATGDWVEKVMGFSTVRGQPNLLIGWISGPAARICETRPEDEVMRKCSELLRNAVGSDFVYEEPTRMIRSLWHSNPNFCGSYSYRSRKSKDLDVWASDLAEPISDSHGLIRLLFAGEATHDHCYSNVHAAVETGWREADRIFEMVNNSPAPSKL